MTAPTPLARRQPLHRRTSRSRTARLCRTRAPTSQTPGPETRRWGFFTRCSNLKTVYLPERDRDSCPASQTFSTWPCTSTGRAQILGCTSKRRASLERVHWDYRNWANSTYPVNEQNKNTETSKRCPAIQNMSSHNGWPKQQFKPLQMATTFQFLSFST